MSRRSNDSALRRLLVPALGAVAAGYAVYLLRVSPTSVWTSVYCAALVVFAILAYYQYSNPYLRRASAAMIAATGCLTLAAGIKLFVAGEATVDEATASGLIVADLVADGAGVLGVAFVLLAMVFAFLSKSQPLPPPGPAPAEDKVRKVAGELHRAIETMLSSFKSLPRDFSGEHPYRDQVRRVGQLATELIRLLREEGSDLELIAQLDQIANGTTPAQGPRPFENLSNDDLEDIAYDVRKLSKTRRGSD